MNWSDRTVTNDLRVDRYTVNDIFVNYLKDKFYVNRRYQRKLVWGIEEKRLLIDSIFKGIPLPAILIAQYELREEKTTVLEIVDGMQRLNAIISFVLGDFDIVYENKHCYFDPSSYNETFQLMMDSKLQAKEQLVPKDICQEFCRYQIPAIITGQDDEIIELIFSRINSTGRKISSQDLRQSMATGDFSDLVRRIASHFRKDFTYDDRINLADMPKISVGYSCYGYGVDLDTVFWKRHDLITTPNMKESKDEEIIETLVATVLLGNNFKKSKDSLDNLYKKGNKCNIKIEKIVAEVGKDNLEDKFTKVFDIIDMIFNSVNSNFSSFIFNKNRVNNKDECFKILFLAIYKLIDDGFMILDYKVVANHIKDARTIFDEFINAKKIDYNQAQIATSNLYKMLKPAFATKITQEKSEIESEIEKRLSYSKIELQMTEFKIGVSNFNSSKFNMNCIQDISKTLVAMSNTNSEKECGLVIVGIANDKKAYDEWYKVFGEQPVIISQHYVPGVGCEAKKFGGSDVYYRALRKKISSEPISPKLKDYILSNFEYINFHGVELLIFKSINVGEISLYNNGKYVRQSNETVKM